MGDLQLENSNLDSGHINNDFICCVAAELSCASSGHQCFRWGDVGSEDIL